MTVVPGCSGHVRALSDEQGYSAGTGQTSYDEPTQRRRRQRAKACLDERDPSSTRYLRLADFPSQLSSAHDRQSTIYSPSGMAAAVIALRAAA